MTFYTYAYAILVTAIAAAPLSLSTAIAAAPLSTAVDMQTEKKMPEPEHWLPEHWELVKTTTDYQAARS